MELNKIFRKFSKFMCMHLVGMVIRLKHAKPQSPAKNEPINKNLPFGWNEKVFSF